MHITISLEFHPNKLLISCSETRLCIPCWPKPHVTTDTAFGLLISHHTLAYIISYIRMPRVSYTLEQVFTCNTYTKSSCQKKKRFRHTFHDVTIPRRKTIHAVVNKFRIVMNKREPNGTECSLSRSSVKSVPGLNILIENP
jgi:hypothetical protein